MERFNIVKFDKDYRTVSSFFSRVFPSKLEAIQWCNEQSWAGFDYYLDPRLHT